MMRIYGFLKIRKSGKCCFFFFLGGGGGVEGVAYFVMDFVMRQHYIPQDTVTQIETLDIIKLCLNYTNKRFEHQSTT